MRTVKVFDTERLVLRRMRAEDAAFVLNLLNDPSWLKFIGDKGVRTLDDAKRYVVEGPLRMYSRFGFGLWLVELKADGSPIGICGLIKRASLEDVDLGFAFLPEFRRNGYALEAASATVRYGRQSLGLERIIAITAPENHGSCRLLEKLGFSLEGTIRLTDASPEVRLYASDSTAARCSSSTKPFLSR